MKRSDDTVVIRYISLTDDELAAQLMTPESEDYLRRKWGVLREMGIAGNQGTPMEAYLRAMHEENGLPYSMPAHPAIADALGVDGFRFLWWLA